LFFLPERGLGLQVVHQKLAGLKRLPAVSGRHGHHHDLLARLKDTDPVNDARRADLETLLCLVDHGLDGPLGHAGVVLELHRTHALPVVAVTHRADERRHRAHAGIACAQRGDLDAEVEIGDLHRDTRAAQLNLR
jgi:hypothetical protein